MQRKIITAAATLLLLATSFVFSAPADAAQVTDQNQWVHNGCQFTAKVIGDTNHDGWAAGISEERSGCERMKARLTHDTGGGWVNTQWGYGASWAWQHRSSTEAIYARSCGRPTTNSSYGCGNVWSSA